MSGVLTATVVTAYGANEARKGYADAAAMSEDQMAEMQARNRADAMPYMNAGNAANRQLLAQLGLDPTGTTRAYDVTQLPGYQQALKQGLAGTNQGLASMGLVGSGEQMRQLQSVGQNVFGDYYSNYMNQLQQITSRGAGSTANLAGVNSQLQGSMYQGQMSAAENDLGARLGILSTVMQGAGTAIGNWTKPDTTTDPLSQFLEPYQRMSFDPRSTGSGMGSTFDPMSGTGGGYPFGNQP